MKAGQQTDSTAQPRPRGKAQRQLSPKESPQSDRPTDRPLAAAAAAALVPPLLSSPLLPVLPTYQQHPIKREAVFEVER